MTVKVLNNPKKVEKEYKRKRNKTYVRNCLSCDVKFKIKSNVIRLCWKCKHSDTFVGKQEFWG